MVLYDIIGPGLHPCHWCQMPVEWRKKDYNRQGNLTVDHLNGDKWDNRPENLVVACCTCNTRRGLTYKTVGNEEIYIVRTDGRRARATKKNCLNCEAEFLVESRTLRTSEKRGKPRGLYCSRRCRNVHLARPQTPRERTE